MEFGSLIRISVGLILGLACVTKSRDIRGFAGTIAAFQVVDALVLTRLVAALITGLEGITSFGLLVGWQLRPLVITASALLVAFSAAAAWSIVRDEQIDCGCLGQRVGLRMGWVSVAINLGLAGSILIELAEQPLLAPLASSQVVPSASIAIVLVLSAVLLTAIYWLIPYARSVSELVDAALSTHSTLELKT